MFNKKEQKNKDTENDKENGKVLRGVVSSTKMTDTVVVQVNRYFKHPVYSKFVKTRKNYKVHDAGNTTNVGDEVSIIETPPMSKDKRFKLLEVLKAAPVTDDEEEVTETKK